MQANSNPIVKPKNKLKRIVILVGIPLFVLILSIAIPLSMTDGTEKFSGKEAKIVEGVIDNGRYEGNTNPVPDLALAFRAKITNVYKQNPEKRCGITSQDEGSTYIVEVKKVTFFGILMPGYDQPVCVHDNS